MPEYVTVSQGDCISSIAFERGFFPDTLWEHPENQQLKSIRQNPNVLMPGDVVYVPDLVVGQVDAATAQKHRFRRLGVPEVLRVRFLVEGEPRKNKKCRVDIDGTFTQLSTDEEGWLEVYIPPNAREAKVVFESGKEYPLDLGGMDPVTELSGVQKRLANLKIYDGPVDGLPSGALTRAVAVFQSSRGLEATGEIDEATRNALTEAAG